jgi:hypothetical protein
MPITDLIFSPPRGTLHTVDNGSDVDHGKRVKDAIMLALLLKPPKNSTQEAWVVSIMENHKYDLRRMRVTMGGKLRNGGGNM